MNCSEEGCNRPIRALSLCKWHLRTHLRPKSEPVEVSIKFYGQLLSEIYTAVWETPFLETRWRLLGRYESKLPHRARERDRLWKSALEFGRRPENNLMAKLIYKKNPFLALVPKEQLNDGGTPLLPFVNQTPPGCSF